MGKHTTIETEAEKFYELVWDIKSKTEHEMTEINKHYTTLFAAVLGILPIIINLSERKDVLPDILPRHYEFQLLLLILASMGLMLSLSWTFTLRRIHDYLKAVDALLIDLEHKMDRPFLGYIFLQLKKNNAPGRVSKQEILVPYAFNTAFFCILVYSIYDILINII